MKECMKARPNPTAKFNYAWALIRSKDVRSVSLYSTVNLSDRSRQPLLEWCSV
jgi:hypothetical protein